MSLLVDGILSEDEGVYPNHRVYIALRYSVGRLFTATVVIDVLDSVAGLFLKSIFHVYFDDG